MVNAKNIPNLFLEIVRRLQAQTDVLNPMTEDGTTRIDSLYQNGSGFTGTGFVGTSVSTFRKTTSDTGDHLGFW